MMRIVLDTNVLVAGLAAYVKGTTPPARIVRAWIDRAFELYTSDPLIDEVQRALRKPYFVQRVPREIRLLTVSALQDSVRKVSLSVQVQGVATHSEDDLILATAISASADCLVTGDRQLRKLGAFHGVAIMTPSEFIDLLDQQSALQPENTCPAT